MGRSKVLLVEDMSFLHEIIRTEINPYPAFELLSALTLEEAKRLFDDHQRDLVLIVMDGCVEVEREDHVDTLPLIETFRKKGYTGPMLASSSHPPFREEMRLAGCDDEVDRKYLVPQTVLDFLHLPPPPSAHASVY